LRGARQVGKSFLVEKFGKTYFENIAIIDFQYRPELKQPFIESREPKKILTRLEFLLDLKIRPNQTLLFLDEIQSCPQALISLRYFKEKLPDLHIIAAGSLLEFLIHHENFSFPVGPVEFLYLKPFSFLNFKKPHPRSKLNV
jgi:predicted AAA+ superfamily ATPase